MDVVTKLAVIHAVQATRQARRQRYSCVDLLFLTLEDSLASCQPDHRGPVVTSAKWFFMPELSHALRLDGA